MWQTQVYLSRNKDKIADLLESKFARISNLAYARAESIGYCIFALACDDDKSPIVKERVEEILIGVLLNNYKYQYIVNECDFEQDLPQDKALVSALVFYNREYERKKVAEILHGSNVYNLDGIFDFRMEGLQFDWSELGMMSIELLSYNPQKKDIYQIVSYLGKGNRIRCKNAVVATQPTLRLIDGASGIDIDWVQIFDDPIDDMVATLIYNRVEQVSVERSRVSSSLVKKLVELVKVKFL